MFVMTIAKNMKINLFVVLKQISAEFYEIKIDSTLT